MVALVCVGLLVHPGYAQRVLEPVESVTDFRPVGSFRMWTFTHQAKDMGRLFSTVTGERRVGGESALVIERRFRIDYALTGMSRTAEVEGQSYVTSEGYYRGDEIVITNDSVAERMAMEYVNGRLTGYFTRGGTRVEQSLDLPSDRLPWDFNLVDQLEMFLARQRLAVGATFSDTLYQPQSLASLPVVGLVSDFTYKELHKGRFDSVFVIHLTTPQPFDCYFTPDRRLARVDFLPQRIRVYLDLVTTTSALKQQAGERSWGLAVSHIPHIVLYLLIGGLGVMFFTRSKPSWQPLAVAAALGAAAFGLTLITQIPLQKSLSERFLGTGGSGALWSYAGAVVPALAGGLVQELLKFGGVMVLLRLIRVELQARPALGAVIGAVFGILEACLRVGYFSDELLGWTLLERGFMVIFHATSGALLAFWLFESRRRLFGVVAGLTIINGLVRYLPTFSQRGDIAPEVVNLLIAALILLVALAALTLIRKSVRR